ncbi:MAG: gliding motility-associated C-terminal domain-containing protein [Bacteroidota bacterium]
MKNISFLLVVAFFCLAHAAWAQPTFYVSPDFQLVDQGDQVCYTVKTQNFSFLLSVNFDITYDAGVLTNASITPGSLNPGLTGLDLGDFTINDADGVITFDWSNGQPCDVQGDINQLSETLFPDDQVLFEMCFTASGIYGNHTEIDIPDNPSDITVYRFNANCQNIMEPGFTFDGFLSIGTEPLLVNISSADGFQGETVCLDFTVENFDELISTQYYIFWDPDVLLFENAFATGLPAFGPGNLGWDFANIGLGVVSWNAVGSPVSVPDGTQILQMCFKIIGNCGANTPVYIDNNGNELIEIIDAITDNTNGTNIGLLDNPGEVSVKCFNPNGINMTVEDKDVCPGETFTVDIDVSNFEDVQKLRFNLKWNPLIIQLTNTSGDGISFPDGEPCGQFDSPGTLETFPADGRIEVDWDGGLFGCDLADGERIMRLHFRAVGPSNTSTTISVIQPILVDLVGGQVVNVGINNDNSLVSICVLESPTLIAQSLQANPGEELCVQVTTQDFDEVTGTFFNISWEPSILSYSGVQNLNLPGLFDSNFLTSQTVPQGDLGLGWQSPIPVSVPDGTTIFEVCFEVIGDPDSCSIIEFTDNFVPLNILTAQSNGTNVGLNGQSGEACVLDPFDFVMTVEETFGTPGSKVAVNVTAENFIQLKRLQHSLSWKTNVVQYDSLVSTGAIPNFSDIHFDDSAPTIDNGQMFVNWSTNDIQGVTVADGEPIYTLYFTVVGDPTECTGVKIDDWVMPYVVNSALTGSANLGLEANNGSICVNQSFLVVTDVLVTDVECTSDPEGAIDLNISGGSGNYDFLWEGNGVVPTIEDQNNLSPGLYDVTITDDENPSLKLEISNIEVGLSPLAPIANAGQDTSFSCNSGVSTLTLNGGGSSQTDVKYFWEANPDDQFAGIIISDQDIMNATVIGGQSYILTVTSELTGCEVKDTVNVSSPVRPATPFIIPSAVTEVTCAKDTINLNGGQPQIIFDFEWTTGPGGHIVPGTETSLQPQVTEPGWYYLRLFHPFTGCEDMDSIFVDENKIDPIAEAGDGATIGCEEDNVMLDAANSTMDNTSFQWTAISNGEICGVADQQLANACSPGIYQLIVTDTLNGCTAVDEVEILGDTLKPDAIAGDNVMLNCILETAQLDGSASSQGNEFVYAWLNENGDTVSNEITHATDIPGTYTLVVRDESNGCIETSDVFVDENKEDPIATALASNDITCLETTATLDALGSSEGLEFVYEWVSPITGTISDSIQVLVDEPGEYTFVVKNTLNECTDSIVLEIADLTAPVPVEAGLDTTLGCFPENIILNGSFDSPNAGVLVQWSGNAGIGCIEEGTTLTPKIYCPGTYTMFVSDPVTGCTGSDSLIVGDNQLSPIVNAGDDAVFPCSLDELPLNGTSDDPDVTVLWTNIDSNPINDEDSLTPTVELSGTYLMTVTSNGNGCTSQDFVVISEPVPPVAVIEGDTIADCAVPNVLLSGLNSSAGVTFLWTANAGEVPAGTETQSEVNVPAGEYLLTVMDSIGCTGTATFVVNPDSDIPNADAGFDLEIPCDEDEITLDGSNSELGLNYLWTDITGMIVGSDLVTTVQSAGSFILTVTNPANQCQGRDTVQVAYATTGEEIATASFDHDPCAIEAILMGNLPTGTTGQWTTFSGGVIEDATAETTLVTNMVEGENIFNWTLSLGRCNNYTSTQITIQIDQSVPQPIDDEAVLAGGTGGTLAINVLENDSYESSTTTFNLISSNLPAGEVTATDEGLVTFTKFRCFIGTAEIEYELCNNNCPELCQQATLFINVLPDEDDRCGEVPNGITPNGDGINDELIFDALLNTNIEYPNNELIVFNRWGDVVYKASPYNNDWAGTNDSGEELPHGTYYFIMRLDVANSEIIRGDVTILK